jgi:hypothetical protein
MDTGAYGAKTQSWHELDPRHLLKRIMEESPKLSKEECLKEFISTVKADDESEDYFVSMAKYWFANAWLSLMRKAPSQEEREASKAAHAKLVEETKNKIVLLSLEMVMPDGTRFREWTGRKCIKFGGSAIKVGKSIKPSQRVGDVFKTTKDLQKFCGR